MTSPLLNDVLPLILFHDASYFGILVIFVFLKRKPTQILREEHLVLLPLAMHTNKLELILTNSHRVRTWVHLLTSLSYQLVVTIWIQDDLAL